MSAGLFSLAEIRGQAVVHLDSDPHTDSWPALPEEVLALVEAVEAARAIRQGVCSCIYREEYTPGGLAFRSDELVRECSQCSTHNRLTAALARFA